MEIQIGPGGTLYGANAFGIAINIITMDPEDISGVEADFIYGSQGEYIPSFRLGKRMGAWGLFQSFTLWNQTDSDLAEVDISRNPDNSLVTYDNSTFESQESDNYELHSYVDYDDKVRLGYRFSRVNSGRGTSLLSTENGNLVVEQPMIYLDYTTELTDRLGYKLISHYKKSASSEKFVGGFRYG